MPTFRDKGAGRATTFANRCRLLFCGLDEAMDFFVPTIDVEAQRAKFLFDLRRNDVQASALGMCRNRLAKSIDQVHPTITALEAAQCDQGGLVLANGIESLHAVQLGEG